MERFHGLERAYGTYSLKRAVKKARQGDKLVGTAKTILEEITPHHWKDHLEGRTGIGIVPIRDDATCYFGAIDIDIYKGLDITGIFLQIKEQDMPLVPFRTKSGGLHLYCFIKDPVPCDIMRIKLEEFAAFLGFGGAEVFPKQDEVLSDRGDVGGWINMPYFNAEKTERYAYYDNGEAVPIEKVIELIDARRISAKEFEAYSCNIAGDLSDGPPCLQYLISKGFSSGTRNDGLFQIGVYLRKKSPDTWEDDLDDYNTRYMSPPLSSSEVLNIVKSLSRKDYGFTCDKNPFKKYCNNTQCRLREFGIGQVAGVVQMTSLTKYDSKPPIWFADVQEGGRLELTTLELQQQGRFQKRCMEELNIMPPQMKATEWQKLVNSLMETVIIISAPEDASPRGLLFEYLERFCTARATAREKEELLLGKPWTNDGWHYFRMSDFLQYLERHRFNEFKVNRISSMIKEIGGEHKIFKLKGKTINAWRVQEYAAQNEDFKKPEYDEEVF